MTKLLKPNSFDAQIVDIQDLVELPTDRRHPLKVPFPLLGDPLQWRYDVEPGVPPLLRSSVNRKL